MSNSKKNNQNLYENTLFGDTAHLNIVYAQFKSTEQASLSSLIRGYSSIKVLTYSSGLGLINQVAAFVDEMEIIFGREDIINRMSHYIAYQEHLIQELKQSFKGKDYIREKIDNGTIRLYVVQGMISHEKLFLLEGVNGKRIISGSANFSEKAFSGNQNESFICFDNDSQAWDYFSTKYEIIREKSSMSIAKHAVLEDGFDIEQLPIFDPEKHEGITPQYIVIEEKPPQSPIIHKMFTARIPKQYEGLNGIINVDKTGIARVDKQTRNRAVQYIKSNSRTDTHNPEEYLRVYPETGQVILSGRDLDLAPKEDEISRDADLMLEYFEGYQKFRGNSEKLTKDYFTFMCWFYISPFICDFRTRAEANIADDLDKLDYPLFGLLYGKSNCGKSELIKWLLLSMFQREGFLKNDWFTKSQIATLREQNLRYPMAFDDMDKTRFSNHAIPLIKEDYISLREYPAIVLSMNADKDTFESEVRKRCLIIYTGASLPDHTGESQELAKRLKKMKQQLGNALYRAYLYRVLSQMREHPPKDILAFSSGILCNLFSEYATRPIPSWLDSTTMIRYIQTKHDKVKEELRSYLHHNQEAWSKEGVKVVLRLEDIHQIRKLQKDVPDYLIDAVSGNAIIFLNDELEEFLGEPIFAKNRRRRWFWQK